MQDSSVDFYAIFDYLLSSVPNHALVGFIEWMADGYEKTGHLPDKQAHFIMHCYKRYGGQYEQDSLFDITPNRFDDQVCDDSIRLSITTVMGP